MELNTTLAFTRYDFFASQASTIGVEIDHEAEKVYSKLWNISVNICLSDKL